MYPQIIETMMEKWLQEANANEHLAVTFRFSPVLKSQYTATAYAIRSCYADFSKAIKCCKIESSES